ncbi:MAG: response regulator transcription factor [Planctomycetes bacterium]|nr:response regulator transcription factor [Planctomycetota bacterium]
MLLVEDEAALARALAQGLRDERYAVDIADNGEDGLWAARSGEHDLLVLDLQLPRIPGLEVCRRLRKDGNHLPILMLTARDTTADVVTGLDAGANDYLVKPFAFAELLARLRALLRVGTRATGVELTAGDLRLDAKGHRVWRGATEIAVTTKELQLLEYLLRHKGQVVARQKLIDALWEHDDDPESNALEVHVASLRRKVDRGAEVALLHTVRGAGYVLREPGR